MPTSERQTHLRSPIGEWAACDRSVPEERLTGDPDAVTCRQCKTSYGWKFVMKEKAA